MRLDAIMAVGLSPEVYWVVLIVVPFPFIPFYEGNLRLLLDNSHTYTFSTATSPRRLVSTFEVHSSFGRLSIAPRTDFTCRIRGRRLGTTLVCGRQKEGFTPMPGLVAQARRHRRKSLILPSICRTRPFRYTIQHSDCEGGQAFTTRPPLKAASPGRGVMPTSQSLCSKSI